MKLFWENEQFSSILTSPMDASFALAACEIIAMECDSIKWKYSAYAQANMNRDNFGKLLNWQQANLNLHGIYFPFNHFVPYSNSNCGSTQ